MQIHGDRLGILELCYCNLRAPYFVSVVYREFQSVYSVLITSPFDAAYVASRPAWSDDTDCAVAAESSVTRRMSVWVLRVTGNLLAVWSSRMERQQHLTFGDPLSSYLPHAATKASALLDIGWSMP